MSGNSRRIAGMLGMARELLVRQGKVDYCGLIQKYLDLAVRDIHYMR
jgi:hypothetical protein